MFYKNNRCTGLTSVSLGNSVTSIGYCAFNGCTGLASITSLAITAPQLENDVFKHVNDSIPVYFPCGSLQSYSSAWPNFSNFIEIVPYSFSVTSANDTMGEVSVLAQPTCSSPSATIQAEANTGYRFTHWSDGETNNPRIVNVTSDTTIIAHFAAVTGVENAEATIQIYEQGGSFYINGAEGETLAIYDVYGRVIYQGSAEDNKPYEMPQSGVYMVKVGNYPTQKVVIKQ